MNYYERIQNAIDELENNLEGNISIARAARAAFMSQSNFYRIFFALTGRSVKEYIRLRRISLAAAELSSGARVLDLAVKYGFESGDAFSRAFRRESGYLPSDYKKQGKTLMPFERINVMEKYFDIQDKVLLEKYPDIKVLKELAPMRVAYYCYEGKDPERHAFAVVADWLKRNRLNVNEKKLRIFGYNNPSPSSPDETEYGYEVCVTIDDDVVVNDENVKEKTLSGGLYAVMGVRREGEGDMGEAIVKAWQKFTAWLKDSKYIYGGHQWLEEHLGFDENTSHIGGIDLYLPVAFKQENSDATVSFVHVAPMLTASFEATGKDAAERARAFLLAWANEKGLFHDGKAHRFFANYNSERIGQKDFRFQMYVSVDEGFSTDHPEITLGEFAGGDYAVVKTQYRNNGHAWGEFIAWVQKNAEYTFGNFPFFEEYQLNAPEVTFDTEMVLHMPVKKK